MPFRRTIAEASEVLYTSLISEKSEQSSKTYDDGNFTFKSLDHYRNTTLPDLLKERKAKEGHAYLTKHELVLLMDWKLAIGKFRVQLPKLIRSNEEDKVRSVTQDGFDMLFDFIDGVKRNEFWKQQTNRDDYKAVVRKVFKKICELKGVGPATASLILSLTSSINGFLAPPYFSDESFIYYVVEPKRPNSDIKYSVKEYVEELLPVYFELTNSTGLEMGQLEKGGWALKYYDIHKIDTMANISLTESVEEKYFKFEEGSQVEDELPQKKKRKTGSKN